MGGRRQEVVKRPQDDTRGSTQAGVVGSGELAISRSRVVDLPAAHKEGVAYGNSPTPENAARDVYGSRHLFGPGYQREWRTIAGPRPSAEAFEKAYKAYVMDPETLYRKEPRQYDFLKRHVFLREYDPGGTDSERRNLEEMESRAERLHQEGFSFLLRALKVDDQASPELWKDAEAKFQESLNAAKSARNPLREAMSLQTLADASEALGKKHEAEALRQQSVNIYCREGTGLVARGEFEVAKRLFAWAGQESEKTGSALRRGVGQARALDGLAEIARRQGKTDELKYLKQQRATVLLRTSLHLEDRRTALAELYCWLGYKESKTSGYELGMALSSERLAGLREAQNQHATAGRLYGLSARRYSEAADRFRDRGDHNKAQEMNEYSAGLLRTKERLLNSVSSRSDTMERVQAKSAEEIQKELSEFDEASETLRRKAGDRKAREGKVGRGGKR